ncbi:hypothetical protein [Streptomyces sp. NPDC058394]|uniref:hypothetical protein n=1 Tax=unclassified Streptomyces TaxID=2593676 RepID=UPI00364CF19F
MMRAHFSLAVAVKKTIREAIAGMDESAWTPIKYTSAVWDAVEERWISDAEVAEAPFTAFTSKKKAFRTTARLIVRRVKRLASKSVPEGRPSCSASGATSHLHRQPVRPGPGRTHAP